MKNVPFDVYSNIPEGLKTYLATNGMNFSKKLYEFAVSMMKGRQPVTPLSKEEVYALMKKYNLTLENDNGYNACYIFAMAKSDYLGSSLANEQVLCKFVQDYLGDVDGSPEMAFRYFYSLCSAKGVIINWEDML